MRSRNDDIFYAASPHRVSIPTRTGTGLAGRMKNDDQRRRDGADENHGTCERAFVRVELGVWHRDKLDFYYYFLRLIFICLHHAVTCNGIVECKTPVQVSGTVEHHRQARLDGAMEMHIVRRVRSIIGGMPLGEFGAEVGIGDGGKNKYSKCYNYGDWRWSWPCFRVFTSASRSIQRTGRPLLGYKNPSMCLFSRGKCTLPLLTGWNSWELMDTTECGFPCKAD